MLPLLGLQNVFLFFLKGKQLVKIITQESAPRQCGGGWQGVWEDMSRDLSVLSPLMDFELLP